MEVEVKIRKATESDFDFIIKSYKDIIKADNDIENLKCTISLEDLKKDIFNDNPKAHIIIAEDENKNQIGLVLYNYGYLAIERSIVWISQIYVLENMRKKGVMKKMIDYLKEICEKENIIDILWATSIDNEGSMKAYNKLGAKKLDRYCIYNLEVNK